MNVTLSIRPLTPAIGAELHGIDLAQPPSETAVRTIHAVLMEHSVVFFRDQTLTPAQQEAFAARFGRLRKAQKAAFEVLDGAPSMAVIVNDEARPPNVNHYHSDGIFRREPEFGSILRGVEVPEAGGDTIFVSLAAAYDALSPAMQTYLADKRAINDFMKLHGSPAKARSWEGDNYARMEAMRRSQPPVEHPLVRVHPVNGRRALYLSESFTTHIVGVSADESRDMLDLLFRHCAKPEFQCRFHWRNNSMAFWDNRATLHYAVADYWPVKRLMHRVTVETDAIAGL